jgi:GNAT superfamily N-acetyltransferase
MGKLDNSVLETLNWGLCLEREIEEDSAACKKLQFEIVKGIRRLQFLILEHQFFRNSENGGALALNMPLFLFPFSLMLHIAKTHALTLLRLPCYFVKLGTEIVGLFAVEGRRESLFVASLGVAKQYRGLGIGTRILCCIEATAKRLDKKWVEVDVWSKNIPAQRLYAKYGFRFVRSEGILYHMRMKTHLNN